MVLFLRKTRLKVGLLVWLTLANTALCAAYAWHSYHQEKRALLEGLDHQLRAVARAVPRLLPPDYHDRVARGLVSQEEFLRVARGLTDYAQESGVFYVYSFLVDPSGQFVTASTSGSEKEWETGTLPQVGSPYQASEGSKSVARSGVQGVIEDVDAFGEWRSWLVPQRSPGGVSYIAGADIEISHVQRMLNESLRKSIAIGLAGLILASALTYWITSLVTKDLARVAAETDRIARFQLDGLPGRASRILEVDQLIHSFEDMKSGLRSFRKYVPADLVRQVLQSGQEARLGGHRAELTVFFSDIADFTALSESMSPEALVAHVGEYLGAMSDVVLQERGTVDKFIGDAIMAFWGAPTPNAQHAMDACRAAMRCQERLEELNRRWIEQARPAIFSRIGLHTGPLIVGNLGSESRLDYTVIGDTVNVASRLEGLNKHYGTRVLISEVLWSSVQDFVIVRPVDRVAVKGRHQGLLVLELLALKEDPDSSQLADFAQAANKAWLAYESKAWAEAEAAFEQLKTMRPSDRVSMVLSERCRHFQSHPPDESWDGVWRPLHDPAHP